MKTNAKKSMIIICVLFLGIISPTLKAEVTECTKIENNFSTNISGFYSWNAAFGAVSYTVDLEHVATGQKFQYETTGTSISLGNLPSGIYTVVVKAEFVDGSTSIIIEDLIDG